MDNLGYLFAGFAVFWAGLFVYILWLQVRLRSVMRELERLEERLAERDIEVPSTVAAPRAGTATTPVTRPGGSPQHTTE
jgi:CcmD family protein